MFLVGKGTQAGTLSYNFPFTKAGARATINYNKNVTDIISGEYESVNIKGDYEEYGLSISRPLFVIKGFKIDGNLKYHKKISDTFFSGVNLLTTDIENQILNITSRFNKGDRVWYTNHNLIMGKSSSGKDDYSDPGVSDEFIKYNAYFENQRIMEDESLFTFKTYLQASDNKLLPSSEQFSLGGMSTVRGFPEGKLIGDQGYYISAEISATVNERTNLFVFLDHGGVFPYKGNDETINEDDYLTGTGMGIIKNFTEKVSGKFVLGLPIDEEELPKLHFALQAIW